MVKNKLKIVVAMSGGVDSSVAAVLLKQAGFDVVGIMMKLCSGKKESEKLARAVAKKIGISFYVINAEKEFKKKVVDYFLAEYKKGNTPNPCVVCNKEIKFGFLIKKSLSLGADFVATGHYAQVRSATNFFPAVGNPPLPLRASGPRPTKSLLPRLLKGKDNAKDQSYFLWQLNQKQLSRVLFPVGGYTKPEVRALAKKFGLPTAETPESQEVCFVSDTTNNFLKKYLKTKPGKIIDITGKKVAEHNGLWFYTIGQRRGLGMGQGPAFANGSGEVKPWFVVGKDFKKNILIVSKNQKDLLRKDFRLTSINLINFQKFPIKAKVKIRYKSNFADAIIRKNGPRGLEVVFSRSQRAVTPGQSAVFYKGKELLGGGVIL